MELEEFSVDRAAVARITGLTEPQIANWMVKHDLLPHRRPGKGTPVFFLFSDVITVAGIAELMSVGLDGPRAVAAVRNFGLYGCLLHGRASAHAIYPGTFSLSKADSGEWAACVRPQATAVISLHLWPIFDKVFSKFCDEVRAAHTRVEPGRLEDAISDYASKIEDLRVQRFSSL